MLLDDASFPKKFGESEWIWKPGQNKIKGLETKLNQELLGEYIVIHLTGY